MVDAAAARRLDRVLQRHRVRIAEVEALLRLRDHDGALAVGREVHVVGIVAPRSACPGLPVVGSIGVRLPLVGALGIVGDPERLQVPRRHDVLRVEADLELVDDLERRRDRSRTRRSTARAGTYTSSRCAGDRGAQLARRRSRCRGSPDRAPAACRGRAPDLGRGGERRRQARATRKRAAEALRAVTAWELRCGASPHSTGARWPVLIASTVRSTTRSTPSAPQLRARAAPDRRARRPPRPCSAPRAGPRAPATGPPRA